MVLVAFVGAMADPSATARQPKLSIASIRKHLKRGQEAARKARSHSIMPGDILKEKQVCALDDCMKHSEFQGFVCLL